MSIGATETANEEPTLLTVRETCRRLRCSRYHLDTLIEDGHLTRIPMGRRKLLFRAAEVKHLELHGVGVKPAAAETNKAAG